MKTYGVDYYDPTSDEVRYMVVDAYNLAEARERAIQELREHNIPKRYIKQIEELTYLNR